jgi:hypothetical protein
LARNLGRIGCQRVDEQAERTVKASAGFSPFMPAASLSPALGIRTEPKIYFRFLRWFAPWPDRHPQGAAMAAPKRDPREARRNFIAILSEAAEEQRDGEPPVRADQPIRRGLFGWIAAALSRDLQDRHLPR